MWTSLGGKGIINEAGERRLWAIDCRKDLNVKQKPLIDPGEYGDVTNTIDLKWMLAMLAERAADPHEVSLTLEGWEWGFIYDCVKEATE